MKYIRFVHFNAFSTKETFFFSLFLFLCATCMLCVTLCFDVILWKYINKEERQLIIVS